MGACSCRGPRRLLLFAGAFFLIVLLFLLYLFRPFLSFFLSLFFFLFFRLFSIIRFTFRFVFISLRIYFFRFPFLLYKPS